MPAPTLISYTEVSWDDGTSPKTTTSISWQTGDVIVVMSASSRNVGINLPTATGLTFTNRQLNTAASTCSTRLDTAIAGSSDSQTVSVTVASGFVWGFAVWVYRDSAGVGNSVEQHTTTKTKALTPTGADGAIVWGAFNTFPTGPADSSATPTPTHERQKFQNSTGNYNIYVDDLADQTSAGSTDYGVSGGTSTGTFSIVALEIKANPNRSTPYLGIWSKDSVLAVGTFDVGIPTAYGLFDDDFVAQFAGNATAFCTASAPAGLFSKDANLIGAFDA